MGGSEGTTNLLRWGILNTKVAVKTRDRRQQARPGGRKVEYKTTPTRRPCLIGGSMDSASIQPPYALIERASAMFFVFTGTCAPLVSWRNIRNTGSIDRIHCRGRGGRGGRGSTEGTFAGSAKPDELSSSSHTPGLRMQAVIQGLPCRLTLTESCTLNFIYQARNGSNNHAVGLH